MKTRIRNIRLTDSEIRETIISIRKDLHDESLSADVRVILESVLDALRDA